MLGEGVSDWLRKTLWRNPRGLWLGGLLPIILLSSEAVLCSLSNLLFLFPSKLPAFSSPRMTVFPLPVGSHYNFSRRICFMVELGGIIYITCMLSAFLMSIRDFNDERIFSSAFMRSRNCISSIPKAVIRHLFSASAVLWESLRRRSHSAGFWARTTSILPARNENSPAHQECIMPSSWGGMSGSFCRRVAISGRVIVRMECRWG